MKKIQKNRRKFIKDISKLTLFVLLNQILFSKKIFAHNRPKVVVIGLGFGGANMRQISLIFLEF